MSSAPVPQRHCTICERPAHHERLVRTDAVGPAVADWMARHHADRWPGSGWVGIDCLTRARLSYEMERLEEERGALSAVEQDVARRASEHESIARNVTAEFDRATTPSQRAADRIATWGGSWSFVLGFIVLLIAWMVLNAALLRDRAFDPFPFILLNLVLSCVAALQAPVILMAQNRQTARDRLQADHDFRVNLKAEIEIASLHEKVDHLLHAQWERMVELQQIQLDLLRELVEEGEEGQE